MIGLKNTATGQVEQTFPPDDFGGKRKAESAAQDVADAVDQQVRDLRANAGADGFHGAAEMGTPVSFEVVELPDDFGQPPPPPDDGYERLTPEQMDQLSEKDFTKEGLLTAAAKKRLNLPDDIDTRE